MRSTQIIKIDDNDSGRSAMPRRLPAKDQVIGIDDVHAHEGSSISGRHHAGRDHTHALFRAASHSFLDNIVAFSSPVRAWNCSETGRQRMARKPRDVVANFEQVVTLEALATIGGPDG